MAIGHTIEKESLRAMHPAMTFGSEALKLTKASNNDLGVSERAIEREPSLRPILSYELNFH